MAKVRTQPKDEEISKRARSGARRLRGRLYRVRDRLFLVGGLPDFARLCQGLTGVEQPPGPAEAPTPIALGFPAGEITPITAAELAGSGRALQKWRKVIEDEAKVRRHKTADRRKYMRWEQEAAEESRRLVRLRAVIEAVQRAPDDYDTPYLLEPEEEEIERTVAELALARKVKPLWVWYGRAAALCACDGGTAPLPGEALFSAASENGSRPHSIPAGVMACGVQAARLRPAAGSPGPGAAADLGVSRADPSRARQRRRARRRVVAGAHGQLSHATCGNPSDR